MYINKIDIHKRIFLKSKLFIINIQPKQCKDGKDGCISIHDGDNLLLIDGWIPLAPIFRNLKIRDQRNYIEGFV